MKVFIFIFFVCIYIIPKNCKFVNRNKSTYFDKIMQVIYGNFSLFGFKRIYLNKAIVNCAKKLERKFFIR
ncbi:MAG: hypothetical protein DBX36_00440 [Oscillospiraceae bacterium]|nr:MAG: hypothetical protein DBX36_00440 [Oscillospiraceae bacterium]